MAKQYFAIVEDRLEKNNKIIHYSKYGKYRKLSSKEEATKQDGVVIETEYDTKTSTTIINFFKTPTSFNVWELKVKQPVEYAIYLFMGLILKDEMLCEADFR